MHLNTLPQSSAYGFRTVVGPAIEYLASDGYSPKLVSDLAKATEIKPVPIMEVVNVLCGIGHAAIAQTPQTIETAKPRTKRLNQHIIDMTAAGAGEAYVGASPVAGLGLGLSATHQLFVRSIGRGRQHPADWAADAWDVYAGLGRRLVKDGKRLDEPEDNLATLREQAQEFQDKRLPVLRAHQIV